MLIRFALYGVLGWCIAHHELFHRVYAGELGPVQKISVQYGHQGPKEIGVSKEFAAWLYAPVKNGGGALIDFGCYGAEWALWLKGAAEPRLRAGAQTQDRTAQRRRRRRADRARIPGRNRGHRGLVGLALLEGLGGSLRTEGQLARDE